MTKILFIIRDFKQGGIPRCLQSLLKYIDNKYNVDLLCLEQDGPYNGQMPNCKILNQDKIFYHLMKFGKNINLIDNPSTYAYKILNKIIGKITGKNLLQRRVLHIGNVLSYKYDTVIAYSEGIAAQIASEIKCKNKLVWIHNDYSFECARADNGTSFDSFNKIVCVSDATRESFIKVFPHLTTKVCTIYNIINTDFIHESAKKYVPVEFNQNYFNIVSVGRVCYQKNFTIIPELLTQISPEMRRKIKWYIIGDGPKDEVDLLKHKISHFNVAAHCILLGNKDNPYPYINNADLFVLTSRYESYPTVINEALTLCTPVLAVDIPPAYEMLESCRIFSISKLSEAIEHEIISPSIHKLINWEDKHNNIIINKFDTLIKI